MMLGDFDDDLLSQWCELYVRFIIKDGHRLADTVNNCGSKELDRYLLPASTDITRLLTVAEKTGDDCLTAYGYLHFLDGQFWQKPRSHLLDGFITEITGVRVNLNTCYFNFTLIPVIPD